MSTAERDPDGDAQSETEPRYPENVDLEDVILGAIRAIDSADRDQIRAKQIEKVTELSVYEIGQRLPRLAEDGHIESWGAGQSSQSWRVTIGDGNECAACGGPVLTKEYHVGKEGFSQIRSCGKCDAHGVRYATFDGEVEETAGPVFE